MGSGTTGSSPSSTSTVQQAYFGKGQRMLVTDGMMMVRNYVDANTQEKRTYTYVRVDDFEFVETKGTNRGTVQMAGAARGTAARGTVQMAETVGTAASVPVPVAAQPSFFDAFGAVDVPF